MGTEAICHIDEPFVNARNYWSLKPGMAGLPYIPMRGNVQIVKRLTICLSGFPLKLSVEK
ncbi:hypothetical protein OZX62_09355 [Bifidobacterium sp. ESL0690]|uniref:hypothetical protein n=1 Tax=Bifidobacterium sp. ESL0690 TaxID=2983214 RepID=UPI0023F9ABA1|nr:hypothetical protein [Bifidobacterium sp. ESL0690]WEV46619.1 hypothetical protein OZX62_09355 [Bifidobacterium sp. ESL0690]